MNATARRVALLLALAAVIVAVAGALPAGAGPGGGRALRGRGPVAHHAAWPNWAHTATAAHAIAAEPAPAPDAMRPPASPSRAITATHFLPGSAAVDEAWPAVWRASGLVVTESAFSAITLRVPQPPPRAA